jgi:hypothetical protein
MKRIVALFTVSVFFLLGCNNTYIVDRSEFKKLERKPDDSALVTISDLAGTPVAVEDSTKLYVRSLGGRRYPVTAFNFNLTESQLVASDRDTLLMLDGLKTFEIDHVSTWKTIGLVGGISAALAGTILAIVLTSGTKTFGNN